MDVFGLRDGLVGRFDQYVKGFAYIRDDRLRRAIYDELDHGLLWPDPAVQINPAFKPGPTIPEMVKTGALPDQCDRIFRLKKEDGGGTPIRLHHHQLEAVEAAKRGEHYVVTTGTGSGKSLAYIIPIVDHVLRNGSGKGVQALIVYPMNALANSQVGELEKFLEEGFDSPPVTFRRYTGQEKDDERQAILEKPPDIILTNYVMLELMLTREAEAPLMEAAKGLKFLVFDELHTYRGRQGSDVAMLIRRVRDQLDAPNVQCVGTSATIAGTETSDPRDDVADYARRVFGVEIDPTNVILETLQRASRPLTGDVASVLRARLEGGHRGAFPDDPLVSWLESELGVREKDGKLVRATPRPVTGQTGVGRQLAELTGLDHEQCEGAVQALLIQSYDAARRGEPAAKAFAFRLHQFITRGGTPYVTLEPQATRTITLSGQPRDPANPTKWLFPVVFCRECGQEYLVGWLGDKQLRPRRFMDRVPEQGELPVYVHIGDTNPWNAEDRASLPEDWLDEKGNVKSSRKEAIPGIRTFAPDGSERSDGTRVAVVPAPFRFCLECRVSYNFRQRSDYGKLANLDAEARSTATTILTQAALHGLRKSELPREAQKLLSFTDNRQDASLQAGHFNDFNTVSIIRAALSKALQQHPEGLTTEKLPRAVLDALGLDLNDYALTKDLDFGPADDVRKTMMGVLAHRVFRDLERGWRVTSPNLEQCGLLRIEYPYLDEVCQQGAKWAHAHPGLQQASPAIRHEVTYALLDHMRRELCIRIEHLDFEHVRNLQARSNDQLEWQWAIDPDEKPSASSALTPRSRPGDDERTRGLLFLGAQSNYGLYLKRLIKNTDGSRLNQEDTLRCITDILQALRPTGLVHEEPRPKGEVVYRLDAWRWNWLPGDGSSGAVDVLRTPGLGEGRTNPFFVNHYRSTAIDGVGLRSMEHTAQVGDQDRILREEQFRAGILPLLFCSPTMELGVDIAQLNVVNMRNVPPTPANYAQRSGRAGRSGQPALVFTYCSRTSPHDQYFFQRPQHMVSGSVYPPSIDLQNEDLIRSHIHAIWLKESKLDLGQSLADLVETHDLGESYLQLNESLRATLRNKRIRAAAKARAVSVLANVPDVLDAPWYSDAWLDGLFDNIEDTFERALARWRSLVKGARDQSVKQGERIARAGADATARKQADRLQREANAQLGVLMNHDKDQRGDFYPYRYFAAEGFLPGYNFPRLPISAFIPGRRGAKNTYLNRPRFIAVNEFGPRSILYHEGSKYRITKTHQPPSADGDETGMLLVTAKLCDACGLMHELADPSDAEVCESCGEPLTTTISNLFRMEGVGTVRIQHINSDEEERRRLGFEIRTTIRPGERSRKTELRVGQETWGTMEYAPAAKVWKINLGERRRRDPAQLGFKIDPKSGAWAKSQQDDEDDEELLDRPVAVVPFVQDTANALLVRPAQIPSEAYMATLQAALQKAIQAEFHVEDRELDGTALPSLDDRRVLLFYEASAGGAGVLRRLLDDRQAIGRIAVQALDILHFDADGKDLETNSRDEACGAACYDCLLSYQNQRDHNLVDRRLVRDTLLALKACSFDQDGLFASLQGARLNGLERDWLRLVQAQGLRPPTKAQHRHREMKTSPDFCYHHEHRTVHIYVDGPYHDAADIQRRDHEINDRLGDAGRIAIRFPVIYREGTADRVMEQRVIDREATRDQWLLILAEHPDVFGQPKVTA